MTDLPAANDPSRLVDDAIRALAARGTLSFEELGEQLGVPHDTTDFDEIMDELVLRDRIAILREEGLGDKVTLLGGVTLTRRLTAREVADGWVLLDVDFEPLLQLLGDDAPLATDGRAGGGHAGPGHAGHAGSARAAIESAFDERGVPETRLIPPPGTLDGLRDGDLIGIALDDARLRLTPNPEPHPVDDDLRHRLVEGAELAIDLAVDADRDTVELGAVLWEALALDRSAFRGVLPPLTELVDAAGLPRQRVFVASTPEELPSDDPRATGIALAEQLYRLPAECAEALQDLRDARAEALRGEPGDWVLARLDDAFACIDAVDRFCAEQPMDDAATVIADAALRRGARAAQAGAEVVLARCAEERGDAEAGERHLDRALAADGDHPVALEDAAWFAFDRGDAARALSLLGRADLGEEPEAELLRSLAAQSSSGARRNDPCPCGSGRKHKRCCGDRTGGPLPRRAPWLAHKLVGYLRRPRQWQRLKAVARARFPEQEPGWRHDASTDPLVVDLAAFDLGLFDAFLRERGALLPDDERELAASWRETERTVLRVDGQHGEQITVTDLARGEQLVVRGVGAPTLPRGEHLLTRVVATGGDEPMIFWAPLRLGLAPRGVETLRDTRDPVELAATLAHGRPHLTTSEGQPLVFHEIRYALPDGASLEEAANALRTVDALQPEDPDEDPPTAFVEAVEVDGDERIRGHVVVRPTGASPEPGAASPEPGAAGASPGPDGRVEVLVDTNADARAARLRALVEAALPDAELADARREPAWHAIDDQRRYGVPTASPHPTL